MTKEEFLKIASENPEWVIAAAKELRSRGKPIPQFDIDWAVGRDAETLLAKLLGGNFTIEVKNDLRACTTQNLAIEVAHSDGTPSGLSVTRADYWCQVVGALILLIPTDILRRIASSYDVIHTQHSALKLIPIHDIFLRANSF